jgi:hypothetical protein
MALGQHSTVMDVEVLGRSVCSIAAQKVLPVFIVHLSGMDTAIILGRAGHFSCG